MPLVGGGVSANNTLGRDVDGPRSGSPALMSFGVYDISNNTYGLDAVGCVLDRQPSCHQVVIAFLQIIFIVVTLLGRVLIRQPLRQLVAITLLVRVP